MCFVTAEKVDKLVIAITTKMVVFVALVAQWQILYTPRTTMFCLKDKALRFLIYSLYLKFYVVTVIEQNFCYLLDIFIEYVLLEM